MRKRKLGLVTFFLVLFLINNTLTNSQSISQYSVNDQTTSEIDSEYIWEEAIRLSENDHKGSFNPELATDSKGNIHVVWYDDRVSGFNILYRKYSKRKNEWLPSEALTNESEYNIASYPQIEIDQKDYLHVSWNDELNRKFLYCYFNGKSWSNIREIAKHNESNLKHEAIATNNGSMYFFWNNKTVLGWNLFYREYSIERDEFGEIKRLTNYTTYSEIPSAAVDSHHRIHITWSDKAYELDYYEIFYQYFDGAVWHPQTPTIISTVDKYIANDPEIAIDQNDNVHIVYEEWESPSQVYYRKNENGNWSERERLSGNGSAFSPDICIGKNDNVNIIFDENSWLQYVNHHPTDGWSETTNLTESRTILLFPKITNDAQGNVHIVWGDWGKDKMWEVYYQRGKIMRQCNLFIVGVTILPLTSAFIIVLVSVVLRKRKK